LVYGKAETPLSLCFFAMAKGVTVNAEKLEGDPILICPACRTSCRAIGQQQIREREKRYKESHPRQAEERLVRKYMANDTAARYLAAELREMFTPPPPSVKAAPEKKRDPSELVKERISQFSVSHKEPMPLRLG